MLSITSISPAQAGRYYQKDSYYAKEEGVWQGKGAKAMGLHGEVLKEDFINLVNGKNPQGEELIQAGVNGERRAGIDLTFSAPKSVSVLAEVLGDTKVRKAHEKAVEEALKDVERNFAQARQTVGGKTERINTGNLVITKFLHNTSRSLDANIHTHAVILNMTQRDDGQWRAISNEQLFENKMFIGQLYRNELAANLKELGYQIKSDGKGLFEVQGFDQKLLDHFSQRSEQIEQKVKELKESGIYPNAGEQKLREIAALGSRVAKKDVDLNVVRAEWEDRLKSLGFTKEGLLKDVKSAEIGRDARNTPGHYIALAAKAITEQESVFSRSDILRVAGKFSIGEHRMAALDKALGKSAQIVILAEGIYTTKEMIEIEKEIVQHCYQGQRKVEPVIDKTVVVGFLAGQYPHLTAGQRDAAAHILSTMDRIIGIQGDAGTGKTTMLAMVKEQLESKGYDIKGLSFTGKAVEEIENNAGIKSQTLHRFLASEDDIKAIGAKTVLVIDEASMVGARQMQQLLETTKERGVRVVLVGDTKQLQSISAGRIFKQLQEEGAIKTVQMSEVLRQKTASYKAVVKDFSEKRIEAAFQKMEEQKMLIHIPDRQDRLDAIIMDYVYRDNHADTIIVTARNQDRQELNASIRDELKAMGKLQGMEHTFTVREPKNLQPADKHFAQSYQTGDYIFVNKAEGGLRAGETGKVIAVDEIKHAIIIEKGDGQQKRIDIKEYGDNLSSYTEREAGFCQGERIVCLKNDKESGLKNGRTGIVESIDEDGNMSVRTDAGKELTFNIKEDYNFISHGYAVTAYKSQGQTAKEVIYHADTEKGVNYNEAYVAATRGQEDLKIYTDDKVVLKERFEYEQEKSSTLDYREKGKEDARMRENERTQEQEIER